MSVLKLRVVLSILCILIGYSIFGTYTLSLRFGLGVPTEVYWLSFVFGSLPLLCEVAFWRSSAKLRLFYLMTFSIMIHLQYAVVDTSEFLSSSDAVGDYRLTAKIIDDTRWIPFSSVDWGFGSEYRFYPATDFLYATTSLLTGIPLLTVVKYLFVIKALVVTPIAESLFKRFFSQRVAYLATAILLASPGAILFPHKESFAVIFFFIGLHVATKAKKTRPYLLIGVISILTLIMTHHFTMYIFIALLTSLFLAGHFYTDENAGRVSGQFYMLCLIVFVAWVAFIASAIVTWHQRILQSIFLRFLLPGELTFSELLPLYSPYERIVVWLGYGTAAFSAVLGFLVYRRNTKSFSLGFFAITLFFVPILLVASIFRFSPQRGASSIIISHRAYEFGYIAIGALSSFFFIWAFQSRKRAHSKIVLIGAIMSVIIVGPIAGSMHPRTFSRVSNVISVKAISMNTWMSESGVSSEYSVGDRVVDLILTGYGDGLVFRYPKFFSSQDFSLPPEIRSKSSYVVTYSYMIDFYGPNAAKFYASPYFHKLYSNGMLRVLSFANRPSS